MDNTPSAADDATPPSSPATPPDGRFAHRAAVATLIAVAIVALALVTWHAMYVLLLAFAGVLVAVLLRGLADLVGRYARLGKGWSLGVVVLLLIGLFAGLGWMTASTVAKQADLFAARLPHAVRNVETRLARYEWGRQMLGRAGGASEQPQPPAGEANPDQMALGVTPPPLADGPSTQPASQPASRPAGGLGAQAVAAVTKRSSNVIGTIVAFLGGAMNLVVALVVVGVVAIYLAMSPGTYVVGLLHLIPFGHRERVRRTLHAIGYNLRWWLVGQGITMVVIGTLTAGGLWLIGIDLWPLFGLLAGLFNFIPNFGPLISFVPAVLFALAEDGGGTKAAWVCGLYLVAQSFEGYVLTPMVQKRAIDLPPALLILSQVLAGILMGAIGVVLAAPLTAAALVAVKMLYVRGTLDDPIAVEGADEEGKHDAARS